MVLQQNLRIDREAIAEFCRRNHIRRLSLFGSVLTDHFGPDSDVDVLVEFDDENTPGLFGLVKMQREMGDMIGRVVDMRTAEDISEYIRDKVLGSAQLIHVD